MLKKLIKHLYNYGGLLVKVLSVYVGLFGIMAQRYELNIGRLENAYGSLIEQLGNHHDHEILDQIGQIQSEKVHVEPKVERPWTILTTLFMEDYFHSLKDRAQHIIISYLKDREDFTFNGPHLIEEVILDHKELGNYTFLNHADFLTFTLNTNEINHLNFANSKINHRMTEEGLNPLLTVFGNTVRKLNFTQSQLVSAEFEDNTISFLQSINSVFFKVKMIDNTVMSRTISGSTFIDCDVSLEQIFTTDIENNVFFNCRLITPDDGLKSIWLDQPKGGNVFINCIIVSPSEKISYSYGAMNDKQAKVVQQMMELE